MGAHLLRLLAAPTLSAAAFTSQAFDVNDQLSVDGFLLGAGQCQRVSALLPAHTYGETLDVTAVDPPLLDDSMAKLDDQCAGAMPFQVELNYRPDDANELFAVIGFAVGNGLADDSPWILSPFAADLEDDVKNINGRNRDYLLVAGYKHTFSFQNGATLGTSFGILDSTWYLDGNEYANDWATRFMNEVFVSSASHGLPSYDAGAALALAYRQWTFNAVGMNIGENDDGNNFNFWGAELGYHPETPLGAGNDRLILAGTSTAFVDPRGTARERRLGWGLSFDQALGDVVGAFLRFGWQSDDASVDYKALYSGGLSFSGNGWARESDNIGVGYAYLPGGKLDVDHSRVFEAYFRAGLNQHVSLTADVQYMTDDLDEVDRRQKDPRGSILSLRLTAAF
jgi:porin